MKKIISVVCILFAAIMVLALPASAATPYQTYTYSINGTALNSPDAYTPRPSGNITAKSMGLDNVDFLCKYYPDLAAAKAKVENAKTEDDKNFAQTDFDLLYNDYSKLSINLTDIETDENGNVYLVDCDKNRIVVLGRDYKVKFIIKDFLNRQGISDTLTKPQGIYITKSEDDEAGKIYVCDTGAFRIVTFDLDGNFIDVIGKPESNLFKSAESYNPVAVAIDDYGKLYVVSSTTPEGIVVMTEEGNFIGYIGAQQVSISAWDKIWRRFQTDEQRKEDEANISKPYNNITITGDFIYATVNMGAEYEDEVIGAITSKDGTYSPVKMLNASGEEIMRRNGFFGPCGEVDHTQVKRSDKIFGSSTIVDVAVGPAKTWSIVDQKRSKVFTYDFDGNLLFAFGDQGKQLGNIGSNQLNGVTYHGDSLLLLSKDGSFTVYDRTDYGNLLIHAIENQLSRENDQAIKDWKEILKRNANFDAAYIGIGTALANQNKYKESLEYFESAYETQNWSLSYKELRKDWISKYILLIPVAVIAVAFALTKFMGFATKYNKKVSTSKGKRTYLQELMFVFHVILHPFDGFWDMKHEKRGSVRAGTTILGITILAFYYQGIGEGYVVNPTENFTTPWAAAIGVLVPLALWVISNWCLTTLFDGEGSLKDIYIATTYAIAPLPIIMIPTTIASNFIVDTEVSMVTLVSAIGFIWAGLLIFFGTMVTHDYTMGKNVITTLGTIVGMVIIMFIAILFSTLLTKMVGFVTNIVTEIRYRM